MRCLRSQETFHPGIGPVAEAKLLHVEQQNLVERCMNSPDFHLWDVGFGAGANVLTAIRALQGGLPKDPPSQITIESFDMSTAPMEFALDHAEKLNYPQGFEKEIKTLLSNGSVTMEGGIIWNLHVKDFTEAVQTATLRAPDAIFYDPYSTRGNLEMWTLQHFSKLFAKLDPKRLCLMTNYTASTYVRVTLLLAGFYVGIGCTIDKKLETTIVSNQLGALKNPLGKDWLERRVRVSHSAATIRQAPYAIAPISEEDYAALRQLPQFTALL